MHRISFPRFLIVAVLAGFVACRESPTAVNPAVVLQQGAGSQIVVATSAELLAALSPANAGARVFVRAGDYVINTLLTIPDGVTLEGEGTMLFDPQGLPTGFTAETRTRLRMNANIPGAFISLGDKVTIRSVEIADLTGRIGGNPVAVLSRGAGDRLSASIIETVIVSPNPLGRTPDGPAGRGVLVGTRNLNQGAAPGPDESATVALDMVRSLIVAPGGGGGLSAFNFAPGGKISISLKGNVIEGSSDINGGVSRPDAVHDAEIRAYSHNNVYRDGRTNPCASSLIGWVLTGGSGPPLPITVPETARNTVLLHSIGDRIERFPVGVEAAGTRRFFGLPVAGPSTGNRVDLHMIGTTVATSPCAGAADFRLSGAIASSDVLTPGDGNLLIVDFRNVTGSGLRLNSYSDALGPSGPLASQFEGSGNRLSIPGSPAAFTQTNSEIDPPPPPGFFNSTLK